MHSIRLPKKTTLSAYVIESYDKVKIQKKKLEEIEKQILITKNELEKTPQYLESEKPFKEINTVKKQWFEHYRHFLTSNGFLVISGGSAQENDKIVSKYLTDEDYFFHSDIHGASVCILKTEGKTPSDLDFKETAEFAAAYSSAWKNGFGTVDVYCVKGNQISKHSHGEVVAKGGFVMKGERVWFRNTELKLSISVSSENNLTVNPYLKSQKGIILVPGRVEKKKIIAKILLHLKTNNIDYLSKVIPGSSEILSE